MKFTDVWNSTLFAGLMLVLLFMEGYFIFSSVYYHDWSNRFLFHDILSQQSLGCKQLVMTLRVNSENQYDLICHDNVSIANGYKPLNLTLP